MRTNSTVSSLYFLYIRMAMLGDIPYSCKNKMAWRCSPCAWNASENCRAILREMPFIVASASGSLANISKVSAPKRATMRLAVRSPMPLITPLAKYLSMPVNELGVSLLEVATCTCQP
jgi:hypothetical protein